MKTTLAVQVFQTLSQKEVLKFEKFLNSPYFNHREDVRILFRILANSPPGELEQMEKQTVFEALFPGKPFDNLQLNYVLNFFSERAEQFLACEELFSDPFQHQFLRCRAFRKRGLTRHFEQNTRDLARAHQALPLRNARFWLEEYQLQDEIFAQQILLRRVAPDNLFDVTTALTQFVTLENLRWTSTAQALSSLTSGKAHPVPFGEAALRLADSIPDSDNPAVAILRESYKVLHDPENESAFSLLKNLIRDNAGLFSRTESRDIYMSGINFCIRRHNRGERSYTREAFDLYREALEKGILFENGILPKYTYNNVNNLAHLIGEQKWAMQFLEDFKPFLPAGDRENTYRYNLAIHHFRNSGYSAALELLREVEFPEVFTNLDVRKMLLRSYFELGEWQALASLLESFRAYLRRQKGLGYHRDSYLNLIKFAQKLAKTVRSGKAKRAALRKIIQDTEFVAEREWLLKKLETQ